MKLIVLELIEQDDNLVVSMGILFLKEVIYVEMDFYWLVDLKLKLIA